MTSRTSCRPPTTGASWSSSTSSTTTSVPRETTSPLYAPQFFTDRYDTPWGAAVNFDGEGSEHVREYFIHNALYWLEEYNFDGLRLDAVHAINDSSETTLPRRARRTRARGARTPPPRPPRPRERREGRRLPARTLRRPVERRPPPRASRRPDGGERGLLRGLRRRAGGEPGEGPGRGLRVPGTSRTRACHPAPSSLSCRTTIRSATGPSGRG